MSKPSKIQEKLQFELAFTEYHNPLFAQLWSNEEFVERYKNITGVDIGFLYLVKNNYLQGYMQYDAGKIIYKSMKNKLTNNFFVEQYKEYQDKIKKIEQLQEEIAKTETITREKIIEYIDIIYKFTAIIYPLTNIFYMLSAELEDIAASKLINANIELSISEIIEAKYSTYSQKCQEELYKLKVKFNLDNLSKEEIINLYHNNFDFKQELVNLASAFTYLTSLNLTKRTAESFIDDLIASKQEITKSNKVPKIIEQEIEFLRYITYFKDETSSYHIIFIKLGFEKLWRLCAQELSISLQELEQLHIPQIKDFLQNSTQIDKDQIKQQNKAIVYFHKPNFGIEVLYGNLALDKFKELDELIWKPEVNNILEFKGTIGSKGIVQGVVRKITFPNEIAQFPLGSVLVAPYTAPDFVPAMKKAVAIVTDVGGVTSHAAIVSRELEIPCIVNTKQATSVLQDGDFIEVDANQGVVRILQKKEQPKTY